MTDYTKTTNFAAKDSLPSGNANKIVKGAEIDTEFNNIATASATKANIAGPTFTGTVTIPTADINGGAVDGTTIGAASASSIVGTTIVANTSINIAGDGATVTGIKDEDDMSSNSATKLATQQSIKAYVDSQVTAQDLDVTDGSSSIDIDLDSESLGILGGTGIDSTASGTNVTLAIDSTVTTLTGSQTLTNKTLTAPTLTGTTVAASLDISGDVDVDGTLETDALSINGTTVTSTAAELNILDGVTSTAAELNILDGVTSTTAELNILDGVTSTAAELNILDGKAFLDEDDMSSNSATGIASQQSIKAYVDSQVTAQDLDFQADSGGALSIDLDSETLTFTGGTGIDTSGSGNAVTFAIDSTVATLTGSQTLTNKSLTAPTLTGTAVVASLDISGDIDVDGTTNLDVVDIDGAVDMASTLTVGSGIDVTNGSSSFNRTHSTTTSSLQVLNLKATSSGDMADGFGPSIVFAAADTGTTSNQVAEINVIRAGSDTAFNLELQTADATRMTIGSGGVDVTGSVTASGTLQADRITANGAGSSNYAVYGLQNSSMTHAGYFQANGDDIAIEAIATGGTYSSDVLYVRQSSLSTGGNLARFANSTGDKVVITTAGKVTIGGTSTTRLFNLDGTADAYMSFNPSSHRKFTIGSDTNGFIVFDDTASQYRMTIDSSGNVGIGATPESWNSNNTALQIGAAGCLFASTNTSFNALSANAYFDSTNSRYEYINTDFATLYQQLDGVHSWSTAASGSADGEISFSESMRIDSSGNVGIGTDSPTFNTGSGLEIQRAGPATLRIEDTGSGGKPFEIYVDDAEGYVLNGRGSGMPMYFKTVNQLAMTIDINQNLLVGTTNAVNTATNLHDGVTIYSDGRTDISRSGGQPINLRRRGSDGILAAFYKEASGSIFNVGSIGTVSNDIYIGTGDTTLRFADGSDAILPTGTGSATRDGAIQLGHPDHRFSDLYLSGGVVFGATGGSVTSKTLDDYEEGTFTPTVIGSTTAGTATYSFQIGTYTKVGSLVHVQIYINWNSGNGAGVLQFQGLPFTANNAVGHYPTAAIGEHANIAGTAGHTLYAIGLPNTTKIQFAESDFNSAPTTINYDSAGYVVLSMSYQVA